MSALWRQPDQILLAKATWPSLHGMSALAVMLKPIRGGPAIELTDGRVVARFTGLAAKIRLLRYIASHNIVRETDRAG
jgi:hypothetical protein